MYSYQCECDARLAASAGWSIYSVVISTVAVLVVSVENAENSAEQVLIRADSAQVKHRHLISETGTVYC